MGGGGAGGGGGGVGRIKIWMRRRIERKRMRRRRRRRRRRMERKRKRMKRKSIKRRRSRWMRSSRMGEEEGRRKRIRRRRRVKTRRRRRRRRRRMFSVISVFVLLRHTLISPSIPVPNTAALHQQLTHLFQSNCPVLHRTLCYSNDKPLAPVPRLAPTGVLAGTSGLLDKTAGELIFFSHCISTKTNKLNVKYGHCHQRE